jgi:hypothetical protein
MDCPPMLKVDREARRAPKIFECRVETVFDDALVGFKVNEALNIMSKPWITYSSRAW